MKYKEFLEYMEANLEGYQIFMHKAKKFQTVLNANRQKKSRWSDEKMEKVAYDMWKKTMENLYNNLKKEIKSDLHFAWTNFIETNNIFETVNDGISEMDFSDEVA